VRGAWAEPRTDFAKRGAMKITLLGAAGDEVIGSACPFNPAMRRDGGLQTVSGALKQENVNRLPITCPDYARVVIDVETIAELVDQQCPTAAVATMTLRVLGSVSFVETRSVGYCETTAMS
jgi:hypothetical protein